MAAHKNVLFKIITSHLMHRGWVRSVTVSLEVTGQSLCYTDVIYFLLSLSFNFSNLEKSLPRITKTCVLFIYFDASQFSGTLKEGCTRHNTKAALFTGQLAVERGQRDAERLEGTHRIRVVHREDFLGNAPELHHDVFHCKEATLEVNKK